ncbi:MAG: hypothetical protein WDZ59_09810 [Pirellulales bacterium]
MNLLGFRKRHTHATQLATLAQYVAKRSAGPVRRRLGLHVGQMSAAEARGYIRARAASVIAREAGIALNGIAAVADRLRDPLVVRSTSLVVDQVARDLQQERTEFDLRKAG